MKRLWLVLLLLLGVLFIQHESQDISRLLIEAKPTQLQDGAQLRARQMVKYPQQIECFNHIINKESHWNPYARNGSHYGLGQMRSMWYGQLDAVRQVEATVVYITYRYHSSCEAWAFHQRHGWY